MWTFFVFPLMSFFCFQDPSKDNALHFALFLTPLNCELFRLSLFLINLTVLRNSSQVFLECPSIRETLILLMDRPGLWVLRRKTTEMNICSQYTILRVHITD